MTRDIRIYLLIVVLPAILLVAGGIRLISLERSRARATVVEGLNVRAAAVAEAAVARLKAEGVRPCDLFPAPQPRGPARRGGGFNPWRRKPQECRQHDLPPPVRRALEAAVAEGAAALPPCHVEVRHACGCVVVAGEGPIAGSVVGEAALKPMLPHYAVVVAPVGGDEAVALGVRAQVLFAAILLLLLCGTLAAGVVLLLRAERKARDEARRKTDFLSNVSHELKTPLTSISLFSEMIAGGTLGGEALATAGATVAREARRLGRLIDGLLDYARLERGARTYAVEDFALKPLLDEVAAAFAPSLPNGLTVSCDGSGVRADREATRRILDALMENAAKYAAADGPVAISVRADGATVAIAVADGGPGLAPGEARRVFDRFWRADNSVTRTTGGTGLGLAIARELARGMGGELAVAPNAPRGCVFTLTLEAAHG